MKQLCNHNVWDLATAFQVQDIFRTFEKQAHGYRGHRWRNQFSNCVAKHYRLESRSHLPSWRFCFSRATYDQPWEVIAGPLLRAKLHSNLCCIPYSCRAPQLNVLIAPFAAKSCQLLYTFLGQPQMLANFLCRVIFTQINVQSMGGKTHKDYFIAFPANSPLHFSSDSEWSEEVYSHISKWRKWVKLLQG